MDLCQGDVDDLYPDPLKMSEYLQDSYEKKGYKFQHMLIPIKIGSNTFQESREISLKDGVNITLSSIYNDTPPGLDFHRGIAHVTLTFEYSYDFMDKHDLLGKKSDFLF